MKQVKWAVAALCLFVGAACQDTDSDVTPDNRITLTDTDFRANLDGWSADYTDYATSQDSIMEFKTAHTALPAPLDVSKKSLMVSGHNRSDDMFMFIKKKVSGLKPNQTYRVLVDVELASQYGDNSVGIGGSPGGSVYLKAGVTTTEPKKVKEGTEYRLNIDKGNQATGSAQVPVLGTVGAGENVTQYKLIQRSNQSQPVTLKTNDSGEAWLIVGTDSGFEGLTTLYYNRIKAVATLQN
ncbi:hypothetical protein [Larkinella soli]|uniref:hypothetical protein n=1 Tax=Larkinella soli TaxID=1770527 RepID=UPI000FFC540D|nr:hypothetical protein [Larkinella soli]